MKCGKSEGRGVGVEEGGFFFPSNEFDRGANLEGEGGMTAGKEMKCDERVMSRLWVGAVVCVLCLLCVFACGKDGLGGTRELPLRHFSTLVVWNLEFFAKYIK